MFPVDVDVEVVEAAVTAEADVLMEDPVTKRNKKSSEFELKVSAINPESRGED